MITTLQMKTELQPESKQVKVLRNTDSHLHHQKKTTKEKNILRITFPELTLSENWESRKNSSLLIKTLHFVISNATIWEISQIC